MKAILKFDLTDVDDAHEHELVMKAKDMSLAMWTFQEEILRSYWKHADLTGKDPNELIDELRNKWFSTLDAYGVDLNELVI